MSFASFIAGCVKNQAATMNIVKDAVVEGKAALKALKNNDEIKKAVGEYKEAEVELNKVLKNTKAVKEKVVMHAVAVGSDC